MTYFCDNLGALSTTRSMTISPREVSSKTLIVIAFSEASNHVLIDERKQYATWQLIKNAMDY